jgi:DNA (cytosine-5)-methyltransferase 1
MWLSPDCTFFSKARGAKPFRDRNKARRRRGLANLAIRWAKAVRPRVLVMENVEEFQKWCPLLKDGTPDWSKTGFSFRRWLKELENCGYRVEWRQLRGCDYGAPTTRKRLFIIARCDGRPIVWPEPTHGEAPGLIAFRTAAECIDFSLPVKSIFGRKKPLAANTEKRIAAGLKKYVLDCADPFIIPLTHQGDARTHSIRDPMPTITSANRGEHALVAAHLARIGQTNGNGSYVNDLRDPLTTVTTKAEHLLVSAGMIHRGNGERPGQAPRTYDVNAPHPTVVAGGVKTGLVTAFLAKHFGGHETPGAPLQLSMPTVTARDHHALVTSHLLKLRGGLKDRKNSSQSTKEPLPTLTASGTHIGEVRAFLIKYYGTDQDPQLGLPLHTITTKHRFGLVIVDGDEYVIVDIGMRMLEPRELFNAQGFPPSYVIRVKVQNKKGKLVWISKTAQVEACGNSVCPPLAAAIIRAQFTTQARAEAA